VRAVEEGGGERGEDVSLEREGVEHFGGCCEA
jgi:hypothetical protein